MHIGLALPASACLSGASFLGKANLSSSDTFRYGLLKHSHYSTLHCALHIVHNGGHAGHAPPGNRPR